MTRRETHSRPAGPWAWRARAIVTLLLVTAVPAAPACAQERSADRATWCSIGLLGGMVNPDAHLADYQWNTRPRATWGAEALAGRGRFAGGLRFGQFQTTQSLDVSGAGVSPTVRSTSLELVGRAGVRRIHRMDLLVTVSAGRVHLGYHPDRVAIAAGGGSPTVVELAPIDEWTAGGGVTLMRTLAAKWNLGAGIDYGMFRLDTAHRNGSGIQYARESFGQWNARFEVARLFERR